MKKINVTFSVPVETHQLLKSLLGHKNMSAFVVEAINAALKQEHKALKQAYIEAENDPDRKRTIKDWQNFETEDWE
ncbi:MAG TPA: hypothetical protein VJ201_02995 [Candidatus Babeliales bacterium]|nr:hypothetical protein [Candidatus Babeliales bacterium]